MMPPHCLRMLLCVKKNGALSRPQSKNTKYKFLIINLTLSRLATRHTPNRIAVDAVALAIATTDGTIEATEKEGDVAKIRIDRRRPKPIVTQVTSGTLISRKAKIEFIFAAICVLNVADFMTVLVCTAYILGPSMLGIQQRCCRKCRRLAQLHEHLPKSPKGQQLPLLWF